MSTDEPPVDVTLGVPYDQAHALAYYALVSDRNQAIRPVQNPEGVNLTNDEIEMRLRNGSMLFVKWSGAHRGLDECALFEALSKVGREQFKLIADWALHPDHLERHTLLCALMVEKALEEDDA